MRLYRAAQAGFRCEAVTHFTGGGPQGMAWPGIGPAGLAGKAPGKVSHLYHRLAAGLLETKGSRTWLNRRVDATW